MQRPAIPDDEDQRLALLKECNIMHTPAEEAFDDMARLAADICETEIALVTLVASEHQWFKARVGIEQTETSRDLSFCGHCIHHRDPLVVEDTHLDARFADNPLVTGDPHLRFYAGVPLLVDGGSAIGALSVASRTPRKLTPRQLESLQRLARQIARELRLRRDLGRGAAGESLTPTSVSALGPGAVVGGRWRLVREIGRGAAGAVFEARDARDEERVAVKVLHPAWCTNEEVVERFAREARVLLRLKSPHVGKLLDVGNLEPTQGKLPYLALEYLEGTDLERALAAQGPLPYRDAFAWCADACDGVAEAHELGVVHRDLKPSNVFLTRRADGTPLVKVLDFGIATGDRNTSLRITTVNAVVGSPAYMAPEQMLSPQDVDARSDIWSMGATLYELVTGNHPFRGGTELEFFANVMTKPPLPIRAHVRAAVPPPAEAVLLKCLRRAREERFSSMRHLEEALRSVATAAA